MRQIPVYHFYKTKYGDELLVDVVDFDFMRPWLQKTPVFRESFYSLSLIIDGDEEMALNGQCRRVEKGLVFCSRPGDVWSLDKDFNVRGLCLVFEKEFLLSFFNDTHFLDRFAFLAVDRPSPFLLAGQDMFERILALYRDMQAEIGRDHDIDQHILRAMLYETLMLLSRQPFAQGDEVATRRGVPGMRHIDMFVQLVAENCLTEHGTEFYADRLCITPNYLNKIVNQSFGKSAKAYIMQQIFQEAQRLLHYTTLSVAEIAQQLHFETATYFIRIFKKHHGMTPMEFRDSMSHEK